VQPQILFPLCCLAPFLALTAQETAPPDARYKTEVLATGMPQPMELEVAPDGRIFFVEIGGKVRIWKPDTKAIAEAGTVETTTDQENGLLGFALDPKFSDNHWIYLYYSPKTIEGQRLSRFEMKGDMLDLPSEKILLSFGEQRRECCHHAGSVEFGPDGCLFVSTGDNTHPHGDSQSFAPLDERPDKNPWDAQKSASNPGDLRGKILRIRPMADGTYQIPQGNLFPPGTPGTKPEIYCMGCRNPWRMTVDQATGIVYWGEVGPDAQGDGDRGPRGYDEINQARKAGNFGWPYFIGDNFAYHDFDYETKKVGPAFDPAHPRNDSPNNTGAKDLPPAVPAFIFYPYGDSKEFPEVGKGGRTACAGPVFHYRKEFKATNGFPAHFDNCLLWWDWERRFVKWARLDKDSKLIGIEPFTASVPMKRMVDAVFGPDGCLYCMDYGETWGANADSKLLRVSFNDGNMAPVAQVDVQPRSGAVPLKLTGSSAGSSDPDGDSKLLKYEWRDGSKTLSTEANPQLVIPEAGDHIVELHVTDADGAKSVTSIAVTAGNTQPQVILDSPQEGDFFTPGKGIPWRATIRDVEEGDSSQQPDRFAAGLVLSALLDRGGSEAPGLTLMKSADCFNCHAADHRIVGPGFLEVAEKYRNVAGALEVSVDRVQKGSSGVWGPLPMLAHGHHSRDQIKEMVSWVYSLKAGADSPIIQRGLSGEITAPADAGQARALKLEATFTDAGKAPASPLTGQTVVKLRNRRIEAELHDGNQGTQVFGSGNASGEKCVGDIKHGDHLRFAGLNLTSVGKVVVRMASAGSGCVIELHAAKPDGPLIAKLDAPATGAWDAWKEISAPLDKNAPLRGDVFVVFVNPGKSGLMNLDWLQFDP